MDLQSEVGLVLADSCAALPPNVSESEGFYYALFRGFQKKVLYK